MFGWRAFLVGLILLAAMPALADGRLAFWQSRDSNYNALTPLVSYTGPGDIVSSATVWYGLRAYNAAKAATGTTKAVNLRRASDNATCDFDIASSGALGNSDAGCGTGAGLTLAAFATQDATASCTIATTTATCTGASSTPHVGSTITGAGVTQPCYASAVGTFTGGTGTVTLAGSGATSPCGTIGSAATLTYTYGLFVATLYDQSGANGCATSAACNGVQATAGSQLHLLPTCVGSQPCLAATGAQFVQTASGLSPGIGVPWSTAVVAERTGAFTSVGSTLGMNGAQNMYFNSATNQAKFQISGSMTATASDSNPHSLIGVANTTSSMVVDGTATTASPATSSLANAILVGSANGSSFDLTGFFMEAGYWPSAFSSGNYGSQCHNAYLYYGSTFPASC